MEVREAQGLNPFSLGGLAAWRLSLSPPPDGCEGCDGTSEGVVHGRVDRGREVDPILVPSPGRKREQESLDAHRRDQGPDEPGDAGA